MYGNVIFFSLQPVVVYNQVKGELSQALTTQSLTTIWIVAPGCWKPLKVKPSLWVTNHNCVHRKKCQKYLLSFEEQIWDNLENQKCWIITYLPIDFT